MTIFQLAALIFTGAALAAYLNHRYIRLPTTIGQMAFAILLSILAVAGGEIGWIDIDTVKTAVGGIDFSAVVLHGMLSFLLFAGALHIRMSDLRSVKWTVGILATAGVVLATLITGTLVWLASSALGVHLTYIYALLFGALISPTDPIAVLSILKQAGISKTLYTKIGGESLFNDGVGVAVFIAILEVATSSSGFHFFKFVTSFIYESLGGLALGSLLGWMTYRLIRSIDDYKVVVLITLALVSGGYALAEELHVSGPLSMVAAGLVIGNMGRIFAMSETTRRHLDVFWELIDEIMNAVLFLLIGLEIVIVPLSAHTIGLGLAAAAAVLIGRSISVYIPVATLGLWQQFERGTVALLIWGGLRGGLSIAMALSLPVGPEKGLILPLTYTVVLFSIFVQGLSFGKLIELVKKGE